MRLATYERGTDWAPGLLIDAEIVDARAAAEAAGWSRAELAATASNRSLLGLAPERLRALHACAADALVKLRDAGAVTRIENARLGPPVTDPHKIVCFGLNYHDHAEEVGARIPQAPIFFAKFDNSLAGPVDDIVPPADSRQIDYEGELAVVIGRRGRYVPRPRALDHVFGAMALNDVSARDLQLANQLWTGGKAIDTFAPCGPALVSCDELGDLQDLRLRTRVDGCTVQDGTTASMIFDVATLVTFLSRIMTLEPGDIIATGTPAGVGASRTPPAFLDTGSVVEVEIDGIGTLRNRLAPAPAEATDGESA